MRSHELGPAIDGKRRIWRPAERGVGAVGDVCCYVAERTRGRPVLLIHDLQPSSSAFEMRPLFEVFRWRRPTFAVDLPGFGLSSRGLGGGPAGSPEALPRVLVELLHRLRGAAHSAADVVALGRGAEPAAAAAREAPGLVRSLAVLEPHGLLPRQGGALTSLAARFALAAGDGAARALFALLVWRPVARRALGRRFQGTPDRNLAAYAHLSARAPDAHRVPLSVLAAGPCEEETARLYREVTVPVLVVHGARSGHAVPLEAFLRGRANRFVARVSPTRGMPQFERLAETTAALERFWTGLSGAARDQATR